MTWVLIIAFIFGVFGLYEHIRFNRQKRHMIELTEELDHFLYSPCEPHMENLEEGYFANMYNQISKLETQFLDMQKGLGVRESEMMEFIENMAHQVKNNITSLQIQIDLLGINADEKQKTYLNKCQDSVNRLTWDIDRLLKSSQLAEGKIAMLDETMDIGDEIDEVLIALSSISEERNVTIILNKTEESTYSGDRFWISQAIENVIKNAIEHTDAGGYVSISVTKSNSLIIIRVEDSGNGIAEQELDNLFRRFYRGSGNKAGYGIGLSMAKDIVEAHHGIIQAGNNIDRGAWFEIRLLCLDGADIYKRT